VAGCCEYGDEPGGSGATKLDSFILMVSTSKERTDYLWNL
jgi:hypothetical protein